MNKTDDTKWLRVPIDPEVRKSLKMEALRQETTLADLVGSVLGQWVDHGMPSEIAAPTPAEEPGWSPESGVHKSNPFAS